MPNTQLIRRRIRSIGNTAQITKAMEMVAASKMKRAQELTLRSRDFAGLAQMILGLLKKASQNQTESERKTHPFFKSRLPVKKELIIVVSSDKGLCGSYNLALFKKILQRIKKYPERKFEFITLGKRGKQFLIKQNYAVLADFKLPNYPTSTDLAPIITLAKKNFLRRTCQKVTIASTEFISTLKQSPRISQILPIRQTILDTLQSRAKEPFEFANEYTFEPSQKEILNSILPRLIEVQIYQAILESLASEHSARMLAMKNATDNAKDIIKELTLTYNSVRQAGITQELSEISAGVEALN